MGFKVIRYIAIFVIGFVGGAVLIDSIIEQICKKMKHRAHYDEKRFQSLMQYFLSMKKEN